MIRLTSKALGNNNALHACAMCCACGHHMACLRGTRRPSAMDTLASR